MVKHPYTFLVGLFLLLTACSPTLITPPTKIVPNNTLPPAASSTTTIPTASENSKATLTRLPAVVLPPTEEGAPSWPVQDSNSLKRQLKDAQKIIVMVEGFRYCPSSYEHDGQPTIEQKACMYPEFEIGEKQRQQLIDAIDDETQAGQIPENLLGGGSPIIGLPYPKFRISIILSEFRLDLMWATERSFVVYQSYYPDHLQNKWDLEGNFSQGQVADVGFVQEKPLLYQVAKTLLPTIAFPPEYPAYVLSYESVVVTYSEKKCTYNNGSFPSFTNFIQDILNRSIPVDEARPAGKPSATFDFWVRGQVYPLSIWDEGKFSYQEKIYKYTPLTVGTSGYTEPPLSKNLGDVLDALSAFTECKAPQ